MNETRSAALTVIPGRARLRANPDQAVVQGGEAVWIPGSPRAAPGMTVPTFGFGVARIHRSQITWRRRVPPDAIPARSTRSPGLRLAADIGGTFTEWRRSTSAPASSPSEGAVDAHHLVRDLRRRRRPAPLWRRRCSSTARRRHQHHPGADRRQDRARHHRRPAIFTRSAASAGRTPAIFFRSTAAGRRALRFEAKGACSPTARSTLRWTDPRSRRSARGSTARHRSDRHPVPQLLPQSRS